MYKIWYSQFYPKEKRQTNSLLKISFHQGLSFDFIRSIWNDFCKRFFIPPLFINNPQRNVVVETYSQVSRRTNARRGWIRRKFYFFVGARGSATLSKRNFNFKPDDIAIHLSLSLYVYLGKKDGRRDWGEKTITE